MYFNMAKPNPKFFALDEDWYMREEIRRRNAEERKKLLQEQKEAQKLAQRIAPPAQMINNFAPEKRQLYKTFVREEKSILFQQKKLDLEWNREIQKRANTMFGGNKGFALDSIFEDDGFLSKWNAKSVKLFERQKKNYMRMHRLI